MLDVPKLDNSSFTELYAVMRRIAETGTEQQPDADYQDPGNTLLELFALLFDMQRFYIDFITDEHRNSYARLLGGKPSPLIPAAIQVEVLSDRHRVLPIGTPVNEGGVPFELAEPFIPSDNTLGTDNKSGTVASADCVKINAVRARQVKTWCSYIDAKPESGAKSENDVPETKIKLDAYLAIYGELEVYGLKNGTYTQLKADTDYKHTRYEAEGYAMCEVNTDHDEYRVLWYDPAFKEARRIAVSGIPNLSIPLSAENINGDTLELMTGSGGMWYPWTRVESFNASGCDSRHFRVRDGRIIFGNHERGDIPSTGHLLIVRCESSLGQAGNIREIKNDRFVSTASASGGSDRREIEMPSGTGKAVTAGDYVSLLTDCTALRLEQVSAAVESGSGNNKTATRLYIKPASDKPFPGLDDTYKKDILAYLEPYRIITDKLIISAAEYVPFSLEIQVVFDSVYNEEQGREMVLDALKEKFPYKGMNGGVRRDFGERITYGEIYAHIRQTPCVKTIRTIKLLDSGGRELNYLPLGPGQLAYLKDVTFKKTESNHA